MTSQNYFREIIKKNYKFHQEPSEGPESTDIERHKYLAFSQSARTGIISQVAFAIIDHYFYNIKKSRKDWKKDSKVYCLDGIRTEIKRDVPIKVPFVTKSVNYRMICDDIRKYGCVELERYNFPKLSVPWLDRYMPIGFPSYLRNGPYKMSFGLGTLQNSFGKNFPIRPTVTTEGFIVDNFLESILRRVIKKRTDLVDESHLIFTPEWLLEFRDYINDQIASIDIVLNIIYLKAEYSPLENWGFDKDLLGERHGRRLKDKMKWIYQISGNPLNIEAYEKSFYRLKDIRNHLNHFDPPCIAFTIEEIAQMLNSIFDIISIHLEMRRALNISPSELLLNILLLPEVVFLPTKANEKRDKNHVSSGYDSSVWPKS